jgi:hypothetical protein
MKEEQDETMSRESTRYHQLHVLNETFINFFGKGFGGKARPSTTFSVNIHNHCQLCCLEEHTTLACLKLANTRPKCAKCRGGHKIDNCGLKLFWIRAYKGEVLEEICKRFACHHKFPGSFG